MRPALLATLCVLAGCGPQDLSPRPLHGDRASRGDELRPTDTSSAEMWKFLPSDTVETFDTDGGGFKVHYTRAGKNAVPLADPGDSGVPDLVRAVGGVYEGVAGKYQATMGFRAPLGDATLGSNGGDARFDVYLLDFGHAADGAFRTDVCLQAGLEHCVGYVVQENDFAGYGYPSATAATRILGSHEYFHGIQDAYDANQGVVISEGTAVWATEQFDPSTNDFEGFIGSYLERTDRSLDTPPPGPVPAFAYGSAIFFEFLSEKYDQPIVRKLWEHLENGKGFASEPDDLANPTWLVQLDALLKADYSSSFAQAFREFSTWNLYTGSAANPSRSYRNGASYPQPTKTVVTLPNSQFPLRVYYASTQYLRADPAGREKLTAALVDDPATADDETAGMALVMAKRVGGVTTKLLTLADVKAGTELLDVAGSSEAIVALINTARSGTGAVLSKRPGLCIGTAAEVAVCRGAIDPALIPDAGVPEAPDAGTLTPDAGTGQPSAPPPGCGCGASGTAPSLLLLSVLAVAGRRNRGHS